MSVRLNKVMTTLNIGLDTVFEFLRGKPELGTVENLTLNSKITDEQYDALKKMYQKDGAIKKNASNVFSKISERRNKKTKEDDASGLKILGKIDLDSLNQKTRPARKSKTEREEERAKTKEQQKKKKNENKVEVPLPSLKFTRHLIYYKGIDGIYTLTDKGISSAFNKFKSRFYANRAQMIPMFTLTEYRFFTVAKGTA